MITNASHLHHWTTVSQHRTSEGAVAYERCDCGRWRVRRELTVVIERSIPVTTPDRRRNP
ncbi:hypothetical protein [Microlunatus sp. GCM10028923]|uniref:hypothetical protein n=1 Tax=Microlunatus sp. GCM10028923 TaxID=3273400 RepID=UPI003611A22F